MAEPGSGVSVVVPVVNNAGGMRRLLTSLQGSKVELVVVDGGSTDGLRESLRDSGDVQMTLIERPAQGIADAFNVGIEAASGAYICCCGADDLWLPGFHEFLQETLQRADDVISCASVQYENDRGDRYVRHPKPDRLWLRMHLFHAASIVPRCVYERVGLYDTTYRLAMDAEWFHRALAAGERIRTQCNAVARVSLGGVSDREFRIALAEYRNSVIRHGICSTAVAHLAFATVVSLKTLRRALAQ